MRNVSTTDWGSSGVWTSINISLGLSYAHRDLEQLTMAVFAPRREVEGLQEPPEDTGVVIEGVEVARTDLSHLSLSPASRFDVCTQPAHPKPLRLTFEVLQKIIMQLDQHKMSLKVQNLYGRLQSSQ
ncbi:hypothetical protein MHYP_G00092610 [Metynnis hypsauchen]